MKQTLVEGNVRRSFMQLGLTYDIDTIPYVLIFDEHVLRESRGSSHFGNETTVLRNYRREGKMQHLIGSTR
jgi:hypothetical protein